MERYLPWLLLAAALLSGGAIAQALLGPKSNAGESEPAPAQIEKLPGKMTLEAMFELVRKIDPEAEIAANSAQFTVGERGLMLVGDENAGRMRIMSPIIRVEALEQDMLPRMLQANFDAVLDARYAVANGIVWSVFIHPLPPMDDAQFANAVSQVFIAAETFGADYTSGALIYGGGDSNEEHAKVLEELKRKLEPVI
ncbi:MAG: hypothetical protein H0W24_01025 [Lysobacter sp.]|nr:hypothetical protein [Lysobacter sp.]